MLRRSLVFFALVMGISVPGGPAFQRNVHPDEPAEYTLNERFSVKQSLNSLASIESALDSFRKLTAATAGKLPREKLAAIGNTSWEMQNLGFINHVGAVRGTLLRQDNLLKKTTYELAQIKAKAGEMNQKDLLKIKREYEAADRQFQKFWKEFGIAD